MQKQGQKKRISKKGYTVYALKEKIHLIDLDGTLVDSMPLALKVVLDFLTENGVAYPDDIVKTITPLGFKGIAEYYVSHFGIKMAAEDVYACFLARLQKVYAQDVSLKNGVLESLQILKRQGVSLNVLTASPHVFTDACLRNCGIYDLFDNVWSSDEFGFKKSNPKIYGAVATALGVDVRALVMVDDCVDVIKSAKSAGVRTVGVYDAAWEKDWTEMQKTAEFTFREFSGLLEIVE